MNIEKIAKAIEADAGMILPELRQSLIEMEAGMGKVTTPEQMLLVSTRQKLALSQQAFADLIKTPISTLKDWEQGQLKPAGAIMCLLKIIHNHPDLVSELNEIY